MTAAALSLPSIPAERQSSPLSIALQRDVQSLLQHQDQLQLRLRLLEAAKSVSDTKESYDSSPTSSMPPEQATALKAWLGKITSQDVSQRKSQPPAVQPLVPNGQVSGSIESTSKPVKQEPIVATANTDDTVVEKEKESHAEAAESSSSSSQSSPLQTPTPANHPPPPFDIFASQIQKLAKANQHAAEEVSKEAGSVVSNARVNIFDQPKSSLDDLGAPSSFGQPLDPVATKSVAHPVNEIEASKGLFSPEARKYSPIIAPSSLSIGNAEERPLPGNVRIPEGSNTQDAGAQNQSTSHGIAAAASPPTPLGRKPIANDDSGWITVTSKKVRQRYDSAA